MYIVISANNSHYDTLIYVKHIIIGLYQMDLIRIIIEYA